MGNTDLMMKSKNFEFLRPRHAVLADLAGFAEQYAHSDPASSLIKQRGFVEQVVQLIYTSYRLRPLYSDNLNDLMRTDDFRSSVPEVVQQKLHAVRIAGNHAAHPRRPILPRLALERLVETFEVAKWVYLQLAGGTAAQLPAFAAPPPEPAAADQAREALEQVRLAEAKYAAVLADLDAERKKRELAETVAQQTVGELATLKEQGKQVALTLSFNEATTRQRLVDQLLLDAGWEVGTGGKDTEEVKQEVPLFTMETPSKKGFADYVLYGDDGKPVAVVEVKKTAIDAKLGAEQARRYADCLEREQGRRPVIFFTNGIDVFLWDDVPGYPYRQIWGLYSPDSVSYLHGKRDKKPLASIAPRLDIAERLYQLEAIKRVGERFDQKNRRALLVQATGTGKTRVAVSLCDLLLRAGWVRRILFLCDRKELRKQADRTFKEFLPGEPRVVVGRKTSSDRNKRIYLATYPAMMECFEEFDVGFFDLIVADESHRSIYKKFKTLFDYFDALEIGLTATPIHSTDKSTYELFGCDLRNPTSNYSYQEAIESVPPYLVPFRVRTCSTDIGDKGLKYSGMDEHQREQAAAQEAVPQSIDFEPGQLNKDVFNKATTREVWTRLMEEGIREATGSHVGKTIVFARNHHHAVHLAEVFSELYPQYGSTFCRVIDNQEKHAEQLIDDFKRTDPGSEPVIAISVDMLDTGIDVPEVVNLVFAKKVMSYTKFWQMIGRGTRLCKNLLGPGRDKTEFLIFDHRANFYFFDEQYTEREPSKQKALVEALFEARLSLATAAMEKVDTPVVDAVAALLLQDLNEVRAAATIEVKRRWRELEELSSPDRLQALAPATVTDLRSIAAPLMHWRNIRGHAEAYRFDLLMTRLQLELVRGGPTAPRTLDFKGALEEQVDLLLKHQNPVKAKAAEIQQVRSSEFWARVSVAELERLRLQLRGIMKYQQPATTARVAPQVYDIDDTGQIAENYVPKMEGLVLAEYRQRVERVLQERFLTNPTVARIKAGAVVEDAELDALARLVLEADDEANVRHLMGHDPQTRRSLLSVFRSLVRLDAVAVEKAFSGFVHKHPLMTAPQLRFMQVLQNYIAQNGGIEIGRLYEAPFTDVHAEGVDGVFSNEGEVEDLLAILSAFEPDSGSGTQKAS